MRLKFQQGAGTPRNKGRVVAHLLPEDWRTFRLFRLFSSRQAGQDEAGATTGLKSQEVYGVLREW